MDAKQVKNLLCRLDEICDALIGLETYFEESGISDSLKSIAESLKQRN